MDAFQNMYVTVKVAITATPRIISNVVNVKDVICWIRLQCTQLDSHKELDVTQDFLKKASLVCSKLCIFKF